MVAAISMFTLVILTVLSSIYTYPVQEEWPEECKSKYYCWVKTDAYPKEAFERILSGTKADIQIMGNPGGLDNRTGVIEDIASCQSRPRFNRMYMLKDKDNTIWYVPQIKHYRVLVETEECEKAGRIESKSPRSLKEEELKKKEVHCMESRVNLQFPVLSQDRKKLETRSPYKGIPVHCSAKIVNTRNH